MSQKILVLALATLFAGSALAVGGPRGNAAAGQQRFEATPEGGQSCASCHLEGGSKSIDGNTPLLAGQYADYLAKALLDYQTGARKNPIMVGIAKPLSKKDMQDLAAYYASLPGPLTHRK